MVKLEEIRIGDRVEVKEGRNKGAKAYVLYKMNFNNEWALNTEDSSTTLYDMREKESDFEVIEN